MGREVARRQAIRLGAVSGAVALAGCLGGDSTDDQDGPDEDTGAPDWTVFADSPPAYMRYLSSAVVPGNGTESETVADGPFEMLAQQGLVVTYTEFDAVEQVGDVEMVGGEEGPQPEPDDPQAEEERFSGDPLLGGPLSVTGTITLTGTLVAPTGLGSLVGGAGAGEQSGGQQDRFDTEIRAELFTPEAVVLQGDIDKEEVGTLLEQPPQQTDASGGTGSPRQSNGPGESGPPRQSDESGEGESQSSGADVQQLSFAETLGEYDIYEEPESGGTGEQQRVAVGPDELVWAGTADVGTTIETASGERERAIEAAEGFARATSPLADSQLLFGVYDPGGIGTEQRAEGARPLLGDVDAAFDGIVYGGSVDDEGLDSIAALLASEPIDERTETTLREQLGTDAERVEYEASGREMLVTGRYSTERLETV